MVELALILLTTGAFTAALAGVLYWAVRRASLDVIDHLILDESGRYVHVFGQTIHMPEDGDSFSVYRHLVLELDTLRVVPGDKRRGEALELDSPFVAASMSRLSGQLGVKLAFAGRVEKNRRSSVPVVIRSAKRSDTENERSPPPNSVILWTVSDTPPRFDLELRCDGKTRLRKAMKGHVDEPFRKRCAVPARGLVLLTYLRDANFTTGVALLVIDVEEGVIRSDELLRGS